MPSKMTRNDYVNWDTVQTHNNVSIPLSSSNTSQWFNCEGYDKMYIHFTNDASTTSSGDVQWSIDGSTQISNDSGALVSGTTTQRTGTIDVKAPYFRLKLFNGDGALSHVMSSIVYMRTR